MLIHAILAVYFAFAFIYGDEDDRKTFLLGSIIFGSFYLTLKLRQLIYSFNNFKLQNYKLNEIWLISGLLFELGEAQELIKELISEGKWNTNEFPEMKQDLLNKLKIQHN
uniref:Uncharacterized protein n=1 Tax=Rhizophagus irregularis (strain DAOM 181602 / DAOM 197198 / MUCL 43194) TaxID=747089 RepID=U9UDX8_RHIID